MRRTWGQIVDRRREGRGFYLRYVDHRGKRRSAAAGATLADAEAFARQTEALVARRRKGEVVEASLAEFLPKLEVRLKHRLSPSGFARVSRILRDAAREFLMPMSTVTPSDIEDWVGRQKWAPATRYRVAAALSVAWREAIREGIAASNPAKGLRLGRVEKKDVPYLTGDQLTKLIGAMPERVAAHVTFLAHTGLRRSELLGLKWADVAADFSRISVASGKTGTVRHVPLTEAAASILKARRHLDSPFNDIAGHELTRQFSRAARTLGLEMSPHDLRHVYASSLVRAGVPIPMVARLLGHSTPVLTLTVYGRHAPDDAEREAVARLERAWG